MVQSQTQQNYISINGIVTQDLNSIIAELQNDFKGIYGENINLESNTSDGQWLNILAQQKIDALDFQVQLYNNLDVDSVVGLPQQVLYKLNGLTIKDFTYSFVYVNVTVSQNVSLSGLDGDIANTDGTGYTVTDMNGNNWILAESISLVQNNEPYLLLFRAQELGQIAALANTITTMSTIVAGVTEVNNPANNFITGQTGETAAEFRTRRNRSLQAPSQGFKESIEGQLLALNDVSDAKVYDNKDDANIDGVQVIVQGGTSNEIGNIIYNNLPPGINTQGAYEATITVNNRNKVLNYDKPNPIPILVKGTIESLTGYPNDVDLDYVKQTLASKQFNIGEIAESANITTQLKNILSETGSPYDVELSNSLTGGSWENETEISSEILNYITYGNNTFVVISSSGKVLVSENGNSWTEYSNPFSSTVVSGLMFANSKFFVLTYGSSIYESSDGITWTKITDLSVFGAPSWKSFKYLNNKYIAMGSFVSTSDDGDTWSEPVELNVDIKDVIYGSNKFVAIGTNYTNGIVITSDDGDTWSEPINTPASFENITYANDKFIAITRDSTIYTSTNGIEWAQSNKIFEHSVRKFKYTNNILLVIADDGYTAMSQDSEIWTIQKIGTSYYNDFIGNDDKIIAVGTGGKMNSYELPEPYWEEILTPTGLADFFVMTVEGMNDLTVLGAD